MRAAVEKAAADPAPAVNLTASLLKADALSPATWMGALENASMPVAARVLAAERMRALPAGFAPMLPSLVKVVQDAREPEDVRASAVFTLRLLLSRRLFDNRYAAPRDAPSRAARDAAERGLRWLAGAQKKDGRWAAEAWNDYDVGVTGLAVLAFLAAGYTDREFAGSEPYATNVPGSATFRASRTTACSSRARCAAHARRPRDRDARDVRGGRDERATRARRRRTRLNFVAARNPYLAWRYDPRGGENDTSVTGWCVMALKSGKYAGLEVDPDAFEGARQWIDKMTEPNFGQCGYNYPGGAPARPEGKQEKFPPEKSHSMTAAASSAASSSARTRGRAR